jgi:hypothetical protein
MVLGVLVRASVESWREYTHIQMERSRNGGRTLYIEEDPLRILLFAPNYVSAIPLPGATIASNFVVWLRGMRINSKRIDLVTKSSNRLPTLYHIMVQPGPTYITSITYGAYVVWLGTSRIEHIRYGVDIPGKDVGLDDVYEMGDIYTKLFAFAPATISSLL